MRVINGDSVRDKVLLMMRFTEHNHMCNKRNSELRIYFSGYAAALREILGMIDSEKTIGTIIGENNLHKLSVKEREHHVQ